MEVRGGERGRGYASVWCVASMGDSFDIVSVPSLYLDRSFSYYGVENGSLRKKYFFH